jgi:hypothetical protein
MRVRDVLLFIKKKEKKWKVVSGEVFRDDASSLLARVVIIIVVRQWLNFFLQCIFSLLQWPKVQKFPNILYYFNCGPIFYCYVFALNSFYDFFLILFFIILFYFIFM